MGVAMFRRHEFSLLWSICCVLILTAVFDVQHNYWRQPGESAWDLLRQWSMLGLYALGAAIVIVAGGIDLSTGSVIAFSGTICASLLLLLAPEAMTRSEPLPLWCVAVAISGSLLSGFLIGSLHAWLITVVGLPPFVATLATLVGLRSLARAICEAVTSSVLGGASTQVQIFDAQFRYLATSVWIPAALLAVLSLALWVLMSRTVLGRHLYALGGNEQAARVSGIDTDRLKWVAYCLSAMLASLTGVLYICEQSVADPQTLGRGYELNAIAAAVVGGCSLQGGVGTIPGTLLGALFLRTVIDGVAKLIKAGADVYEGLIVGVVVVLAVTVTASSQRSRAAASWLPGWLGLVTLINLTILAGLLAALIGHRFLTGWLQMNATWLATLAMLLTAVWLCSLRPAWSATTRQRASLAIIVGAFATLFAADRLYPGVQRSLAMQAVKQQGGSVVQNDLGIVVDLRRATIDDAGLRKLAQRFGHLGRIAELRLSGTAITDRSLDVLTRMTDLRKLELSEDQLTRTGRQRLQRQLPKLQLSPAPANSTPRESPSGAAASAEGAAP
jgi:ribose/xylose/arabinose/galactoside ABC-type transport system permease subunit